MKPRLFICAVVLVMAAGVSLSCEDPGPLVERITAEDPVLRVSEATMLYCYVYNPSGGELTYGWLAQAGRIQNMGDSARWTAPDTVAADSLFWVSVTVSDEWGRTDEDSISLEVSAPPYQILLP